MEVNDVRKEILFSLKMKRIKIKEAAEKSGTTRITLSRFLNGHTGMRTEAFIKLIQVAGLTITKAV